MTIKRLLLAITCLLMMVLAAAAPAAAATYTWNGPNAGAWNDAANWSPSTGFPNSTSDIAIINGGASPLAIAIPSAAGAITIAKLQVNSGAGLISIVGLAASLTLVPADDVPAIVVSGVGGLELNTPVFLARNCIVSAGAGSGVVFQRPIGETSSAARELRKQGTGEMRYNASNTYTGGTRIEQGTLMLTGPNTIPDTSVVDVTAGATLLALKAETIGLLSVRGTADISGAEGTLTVSQLIIVGGTILSSTGGRKLVLGGDVIAAANSADVPATIEASVTIELFENTRTITVTDGPAPIDMQISAGISGPAGPPSAGLIKVGAGTLSFLNSGKTNDYQGLTWVKEGRLLLARQLSSGDLRIGDGGLHHAEVIYQSNEMILSTKSVTVDANALYELADHSETIDQLTVNGGTVHIAGTNVSLRPRVLVMTGGVVDTGGTSIVAVPDLPNNRFEATSTATQTAVITGTGSVMLEGDLNLIVNNGPQAIDLSIDVKILLGHGVTKTGAGVARFTKDNEYIGDTNVAGGTLLINGQQPSSRVAVGAAATLGGTGTITQLSAAAGATIAPGASAGVLRVTSSVKIANPGVTFAVEIASAASSDQLRVTGTVSMNGATLAVAVGTGVTLPVGSKFTIIDNDGTDAIAGTFGSLAEGATVISERHAFSVSYRGGDGNDVVLTVTDVGPDVLTYYLAEGATGGFFDEDVLIANPNDSDAPVTLTFLQEGGGTVVEHRTVPKQARLTVHVDQIAGLENASPSVQVASDNKLPLIVERTMYWDASFYGGHTANAVAKPDTKWILAEGFQGFFDTFLLIANANPTPTTATVTFLRENDTPVVKTIPIAAFARKTIYAGDFSELLGRAFGIVVDSPLPVIAERSMYFASLPNRLWTGGHANTGVNAPSTSWFHAEGATGGFFSTFILLSNPQTTAAHIELRFLLEDGTTIVRNKTLAAGQRLTVNPAAEGEPRLENAAMSTIVASDVPIVSERSMYWPGDATPFGEGHNSSGVTATSTRWGLAEGRIGAPRNFTTYILLANPSANTAEVTVTYLRETGAPVTKKYTVQPTSRFNIDVAGVVPELHDESFGARIEVTNGVPIAVERSLYWDANGIFWAGGTNALATPLP